MTFVTYSLCFLNQLNKGNLQFDLHVTVTTIVLFKCKIVYKLVRIVNYSVSQDQKERLNYFTRRKCKLV